jgi:hypothetical protein
MSAAPLDCEVVVGTYGQYIKQFYDDILDGINGKLDEIFP